VDGPHVADEPRVTSEPRHPVLAGVEWTDILPYGSTLDPLRVAAGATVAGDVHPRLPRFSARDGIC
jgi:hypothetical protein